MSLPRFYPWQEEVARAWLGPEQRRRFAHAWLIHGLAGIGKVEFARAAAASLLCEAPDGAMACGHCPACTWYASGNHPDFRRIRPEAIALAEGQAEEGEAEEESADADGKKAGKRAPSREIRIEQIRAMESWANTGTHRGGLRVVVLYPAESLNTISANGLLKILEEPPPQTVFLLVSDAPDRLLPTLVSRCRRLPLGTPALEPALAWLQARGVEDAAAQLAAAGGAPVAAWRRAEAGVPPRAPWLDALAGALAQAKPPDVGQLVDALDKIPPAEWIDALQRLVTDVALAQAGMAARYFPELASQTAKIGERAARTRVAELSRWLSRQRRIADHPLNARLFAQDVLTQACAACLGRPKRAAA
ncbi:DNA polymerase III subunit delta' [Pigmentiphaga sp. NML080357]|uniref:DNA polymerase III subunit delta' n=1 Tax=Pigmentiphaga sp. NML080357 TaxID=2008675 RepID=UPI000B41B202|nr:DNA polymerase III subunit delta' [Pigmentiphaga sp. NML080357]OVZ59989.1 DNA polymerase III subunit delta' [Pigmentiphaga sp. NML080357]